MVAERYPASKRLDSVKVYRRRAPLATVLTVLQCYNSCDCLDSSPASTTAVQWQYSEGGEADHRL